MARKPVIVVIAVLASASLVLLGVSKLDRFRAAGTKTAGMEKAVKHAVQRPPSFKTLQISGAPSSLTDLGKGNFIVAMLSTTCDHCEQDMDKLDEYAGAGDLPPIVALMLGDEQSLEQIRQSVQPSFTTQLLDTATFFRLIGNAPPRVYIVKDGEPVKFWDEIPKLEELTAAANAV